MKKDRKNFMNWITILRNRMMSSTTMILSVLILTVSCQETGVEPEQRDSDEIVVNESATVINDETNQGLMNITNYALTFTNGLRQIDELEEGDIIVSGVHKNAPYGYLKRVTRITRSSNQVTLNIEQARLTDVFMNGKVKAEKQLRLDNLKDPNAKMQGSNFVINIESILLDKDGNDNTERDQLRVDGTITIEPTLLLNARFSWGTLDYFKAGLRVEKTNEFTVTAGHALKHFGVEKDIWTKPLSPITLVVAGVPVVVNPYIILTVGANGAVYVNVQYSFSQTLEAEGSAVYDDGSWGTVKYNNITGSENSIDVEGGVEASVYGEARLEFRFYNSEGHTADISVQPSVNFEASCHTSNGCDWSMAAELEGRVDVDLDLLAANLNWGRTLWNKTYSPFATGSTGGDDSGDDDDDGGGSGGGGGGFFIL